MTDFSQKERADGAGAAPSLSVVTVDSQGRVPTARAARAFKWGPRQRVELSIADGVLRLSALQRVSAEAAGVSAVVDGRRRVQVPYGVQQLVGLTPGVAAVALTTVDHQLVLVPAARLVSALGAP